MKWEGFVAAVDVDLAAACTHGVTGVLIYNILPQSDLHVHVFTFAKLQQGSIELATS